MQVMADPTEPTRYVFAVLDAGLTLPDPKMYAPLFTDRFTSC